MAKQKYGSLLIKSMKDWRFWTKLIIGLTQILSVIIFISVGVKLRNSIYFVPENLSYFTTWSNIFSAIFFIYSAMFHYNEGKGKFDNSEVAKIVVTYMTLTIAIYNLNQIMSDDPYIFEDWIYLMSFICEHSLVPILAILYYLLFYNHENAKTIKEFSRKWVWYMVLGLVLYLTIFSVIGFIGKALGWKPLFGTNNPRGEQSNFVYPFLDWYRGSGFFKGLASWLECIVMLFGTILFEFVVDYMYTIIVLGVKGSKWQKKLLHNVKVRSNF